MVFDSILVTEVEVLGEDDELGADDADPVVGLPGFCGDNGGFVGIQGPVEVGGKVVGEIAHDSFSAKVDNAIQHLAKSTKTSGARKFF